MVPSLYCFLFIYFFFKGTVDCVNVVEGKTMRKISLILVSIQYPILFPALSFLLIWKLVGSLYAHICEAEQHLGSQMYSENVPRHCFTKTDLILLFFFKKSLCRSERQFRSEPEM